MAEQSKIVMNRKSLDKLIDCIVNTWIILQILILTLFPIIYVFTKSIELSFGICLSSFIINTMIMVIALYSADNYYNVDINLEDPNMQI